MSLTLYNLDPKTRKMMCDEIRSDITNGKLHISKRLTAMGVQQYPNLLEEAALQFDDVWLAQKLSFLLNSQETYIRAGKQHTRKVPSNAHESLAEGEFNRFYLRGLCLRAKSEEIKTLVIYRAKPVRHPRPESEDKIGTHVDVDLLLNDLRENIGIDTFLGLPSGPNSGLSARLP